MGFSGKLIGAGLGFLGGGPLGAVIGGIIGHLVKDSPLTGGGDEPDVDRQRQEFFFLANLVGIMAAVLKADGEVHPEEIQAVRRFFAERLGYREENLEVIRTMLKECLDKPLDLEALCLDFRSRSDYSSRLLLMECLDEIARADGKLHPSEMAVIDRVAILLNVSDSDRRRTAPAAAVKGDREVLGVGPDASAEEVRRAYLDLVKKYHPDRVSHLGEEFKELAHKKFIEIQGAYERLSGSGA